MQAYLDLMRHILDHGVRKEDRTGTGTLSVFGYQMRFDLAESFPLMTTKRVWMKGVLHELLWFLGCYDSRYKRFGLTNIKYLVDNDVHIWDEWVYESYKKQVKHPLPIAEFIQKIKDDNRFALRWGSLGNVYQKQWLAWQVAEQISPRYVEPESPVIESVFPLQKPSYVSNYMHLVGNVYSSRCGNFTVLKEYAVRRGKKDDFSRYAYDVQFLKTGYISRNHTKQAVLKGAIKDRYYPAVEGVGCLGNPDDYTLEDKDLLYQTWIGLLKRCYSTRHNGYTNYGGKGVFMDKQWLVFSQFVRQVKKIPNWLLKKTFPDEYTLDKDYFKSNKYSQETCIWLSKEDQNANTQRNKTYMAISPEKHAYVFTSIGQFARQWGMTSVSISDCLKGRLQSYQGWMFTELNLDNFSVRHVNQIREIVALIKHNPDSRRIILNAWNVAEIDKMALPPCHTMAQFYVAEGKLSCQLYQRSADVFLGVPFNIASYALLTMMIAQVCDLQPGEFIWTGGDTHLYTNHLEQVQLQLSREPRPLPQMRINPEVKDIFGFRYEDFSLENYNPHPAIKAPVAV